MSENLPLFLIDGENLWEHQYGSLCAIHVVNAVEHVVLYRGEGWGKYQFVRYIAGKYGEVEERWLDPMEAIAVVYDARERLKACRTAQRNGAS